MTDHHGGDFFYKKISFNSFDHFEFEESRGSEKKNFLLKFVDLKFAYFLFRNFLLHLKLFQKIEMTLFFFHFEHF